jgi:diacylglycerol kinase (ATP)
MPSDRSFFIISNPAAGRGRAATLAADCAGRLARFGTVEEAPTTGPGEESDLTRKALARGFTAIIAVGGDGTWGKVAGSIVASGRRDVTLGLLPAGTGNDFAKSIGIRAANIDAAIRGIEEGRRRTIDVGRAGSRYFLNVVGFGFDIAVIDDAKSFPVLHGDLLYRFCALRQLFKFTGIPIEIADESGSSGRRRHLMLTVSNGNYFGGSFHIAPGARLDDGRVDAVSILDAAPLTRAALFSRVSKGTHGEHEMVSTRSASRFAVSFDSPVRYELDGDVYDLEGTTLEIEAVPRALSVYVPVE